MPRKKLLTLSVSLAAFCLLLAGSAASQPIQSVFNEDRDRGEKLYRDRKYSEAATALKKAIKRNKSDSEAWYYLGLALIPQKELKNATKAFETALKFQPESVRARTGLAYVFLLRNKLIDALRESERALSVDANYADTHYVLGVAHLHLGSREKALKEAERAIELNQEFADAYLLKSRALVQFSGDVLIRPPGDPQNLLNRYQEAASALEKYLQLAPTSSDQQLWRDQLESLKFHVATRSESARQLHDVYTSREVTTKVRLIAKPEPVYTETARGNDVTGTVILKSVFAADGKVKYIVVVYGLPDGLTWQAVRAAKAIKFVPATVNGRPVSMFMQLEYNFNLY